MDRRIVKSRQAIMESFLALLASKGFEKITINDIAESANVNRGTVYLHYRDKFDLLEVCIDAHVQRLLDYCDCDAPNFSDPTAVKAVFENLAANFETYAIFLRGDGIPLFRKRLSQAMTDSLGGLLAAPATVPAKNRPLLKTETQQPWSGKSTSTSTPASAAVPAAEITISFVSSAVIGVLEWWFNQENPSTVDEVTATLWTLLEPHYRIFGQRLDALSA